ncbi:NUDIX hydrolase [Deinococcus radiophilus]|uniref:NUDIX domain-containing protein n=1 Tax=Deinococcus radiophilus TaxID=32062 RepID=A0A3S0JSZ9_9DEIO|nr:NUDIX domain-containing protein [Deinococcus radiophilus]RTR28329.1 NUDIX domain-containing protein [Deinococcus radiophilus]UFA51195.1 NUDIX domain-containing protein [Deinococcus radiophilus]
MITPYPNQAQARADAAARSLREKAVCLVVRGGADLLVFDHIPDDGAGVQLPAGGVEPGEPPADAALRELWEESGLRLSEPHLLCCYLWEAQLPHRFTRQVCHAYAFAAPTDTPDNWQHHADGHLFAFRWADVTAPGLDWEMDAAMPFLIRHMTSHQENL